MDIKKISIREKIGFAIGLALLLFLGSLFLNSYAMKVLGSSSPRRDAAVVRLRKEKPGTIEILTIGDSESYTTISPMQIWQDTGYTAYVGGQSGQTMNEMLTMLETGLKMQKLKVVLMETNALFRSSGNMNQLQEMMAAKVGSVIPFFQYHDLWKNAIIKPAAEPRRMSNKGFDIRDAVKPYNGSRDYMQSTSEEERIPKINLLFFDRIVQLCREKGIPLILYSGPSPVNYNMKKHNRLEKLASDYNLQYIDMNMQNEEIGIDWSRDTLDGGDHVNISGAQKTTAYMETILRTLNLTDYRGDAAYQEWNDLAEAYQKRASEAIGKIRGKSQEGKQAGK